MFSLFLASWRYGEKIKQNAIEQNLTIIPLW